MTRLSPASRQDGSYPRPQLVREHWTDLGGAWSFAFDDADEGLAAHWAEGDGAPFTQTITVPFPPESSASGIGDTGPHRIFWYRRDLPDEALRHDDGDRVVLHFGAVDHDADVWIDGHHVARHEGGQTPFEIDVTDALTNEASSNKSDHTVVVRAYDDPDDVEQARGKQDWRDEPHAIWYERTSGIWQPVWAEVRPRFAIARADWATDLSDGSVTLSLETTGRPPAEASALVTLSLDGDALVTATVGLSTPRSEHRFVIPLMTNDQEHDRLAWGPGNPVLFDAEIELQPSGDTVASYFGMRSIAVEAGRILLNNRPIRLRAVLEQGYWPESHLAAPSVQALHDEVKLILDLGFNTARIHQKVEDPRFLFQADRQGLMIWGETASADTFSPRSVQLLAREWVDIVRRDVSHPSIVTWVPLNESWGIQHIMRDARQEHYANALYHLAKALDGTRPVVGNDGWEQPATDILTVHDYDQSGTSLSARYEPGADGLPTTTGYGPAGRRYRVHDDQGGGEPVVVSEMGGINFASTHGEGSWGYSEATDAGAFEDRLREQIRALREAPAVVGFCYTQLTDTLQETNGLTTPDRVPKIDAATIRSIMTGIAQE